MARTKSPGRKVSFTVNIGRGLESEKILSALKSKAKASGQTFPDFVLSSCFHACKPSTVKPEPIKIMRHTPNLPIHGNPSMHVDYSEYEEPLPRQHDASEIPSGRPA